MEDGDLYEITAKGLKAVVDHPTESGRPRRIEPASIHNCRAPPA